MMRLRILLDNTSGTSLYRWLAQDGEIKRQASISLGDPEPGEMGGALEIVNIILSNSLALSNLVVAIAAWRATRRSTTKVVIEQGTHRVVIEGDSPEAVERAITALQENT